MFNDQDKEFDKNKLPNVDSVTVNKNPTSDNESSTKKYFDVSIGEGTIVRFNQTLENYLKVSVGNDPYNLTKHEKIQITDTTEIKFPNIGSDLLQKWFIESNNKKIDSKVGNFIKSIIKKSPTGPSGATTLPPIGKNFMYIETSSNIHGSDNIFVLFERTDIIRSSNITFSYNKFSILTNDFDKPLGTLIIQLLLEDITWSTLCKVPTKIRYSELLTDWTLVSFNFAIQKCGIKLIYGQKDTSRADMCFSNTTITLSVC